MEGQVLPTMGTLHNVGGPTPSDAEALGHELDALLERVESIKQRLDELLEKEEQVQRYGWFYPRTGPVAG